MLPQAKCIFVALTIHVRIHASAEYTTALEALVGAFRQQAESDDAPPVRLAAVRLRERFDLTEGQTEVLAQTAEALAAEREQLQRLEALVAIGQISSVTLEEHQHSNRWR